MSSTAKKRNPKNAPRRKPAQRQMVVYKNPPRAKAPRQPKKDTFLGMEKPDSLGANLGAFIGHGAQKLIKAITGFGDYNIDKNSIIEGGMSPPQVVNTIAKGGFIVRHREYIADVIATTSFTNTVYDINPGLTNSFPYLSQIATAFELYRMRGLVYEFKSTSSDAVLSTSASSALGVVAMATQYNSLNAGFPDLVHMENHEFATSSKPSCDFYHPVECKKSLLPASELYVRTGSVPSGGDIRLFDLGQFNIATSGMQNATGVIGQLWCTYEVEFYQARYAQPQNIPTDKIQCTGCTGASAWFGTSLQYQPGSSIGTQLGPNTIFFPTTAVGKAYFIYGKWVPTGGAATFTKPNITATNCTPLSIWCAAAGFDNNVEAGSASATLPVVSLGYWVQVTGINASLLIQAGTMPTAFGDIVITQVNSNITS